MSACALNILNTFNKSIIYKVNQITHIKYAVYTIILLKIIIYDYLTLWYVLYQTRN